MIHEVEAWVALDRFSVSRAWDTFQLALHGGRGELCWAPARPLSTIVMEIFPSLSRLLAWAQNQSSQSHRNMPESMLAGAARQAIRIRFILAYEAIEAVLA